MRGGEGKRQGRGEKKQHTKKRPDKTSARFAHLCQAERARPAVRGRRRRRDGERLRGGGRREKKGGGDGGMVPTSTSARNCFGGKCIIMKAGVGLKSTANAKSPRKQLKCHCFSQPAQIPDNFFFISPSLFSHLFSDDILSSLFSSLTLFQRDLAIDTPQA